MTLTAVMQQVTTQSRLRPTTLIEETRLVFSALVLSPKHWYDYKYM